MLQHRYSKSAFETVHACKHYEANIDTNENIHTTTIKTNNTNLITTVIQQQQNCQNAHHTVNCVDHYLAFHIYYYTITASKLVFSTQISHQVMYHVLST